MILIDKLAYSSAIREKSPTAKSVFAVGALLICVGAQSLVLSLITLIMMGGLTVGYSKITFNNYVKLMVIPLAFLILGTIPIAVNFSREPMDFLNLAFGTGYISISYFSLLYATRLMLVSLSAASCLYFLILTTTLLDLLHVLKMMKCPSLIIEIMMLAYRYIFILLDMASAIMIAQRCRLGNRNPRSAIKGMGEMLVFVFMDVIKRANMIFDAMEARGYDGEIRMLYESKRSSPLEKAAILGILLLLLVVGVVFKACGVI